MEQTEEASGVDASQRFSLTSERAREREVYRHLRPWLDTYENADFTGRSPFPLDPHAQPPTPKPCHDIALAAFAQLCALRLQAQRCLVSLISSKTEYVLVESTRTMSLQYDLVEDVRDRLWVGTCSFPRDDGINSSALRVWRKAQNVRQPVEDDDVYFTETLSPHVCVISDLRNHPDHKLRPFTRHCPSDRFYVSIPLRTPQGFVVGAVTVLDSKPRYGVSALELNLMEDVADTVTGHLDAVIVRSVRQRSERLIQGLGLFNSGKSSLRSWWIKQEESRLSNVGRHTNNAMSSTDRRTRMDEEFGTRDSLQDDALSSSQRQKRDAPERSHPEVSEASDRANSRAAKRRSGSTAAPTPRPDSDNSSGAAEGNPVQPQRKRLTRSAKSRSNVKDGIDHFDLPAASAQTYARACNLIREALGCDGVVMLNSSAVRISRRSSGAALTGSASSPASGNDSSTVDDPLCTIQGFSTRSRDSLNKSRQSTLHFGLTDNALLRLVKRYPYGQVFNFGEDGSIHSSSGDDGMTASSDDVQPSRTQRRSREGQILARVIPGVRSVTFHPLWDGNQDRHRSCIFIWSIKPMRFFSISEDLTYLSAWSHSLIAELSRLEMLAADRAKGTFISSVSHELRSPLHGILAGVELLSDTDLSVFQKEMTQTISMAGNTLLDTVNHILDYSKISSFTRAQKKTRSTRDASRHRSGQSGDPHEMGVRFDLDLARLTEEVVETIMSARRHERLVAGQIQSPEESSVYQQRLLHPRAKERELSVTLEIVPRQSWVVELQPGGWSRIISNLVGNALKYTLSGKITVRLAASEQSCLIDGKEHFKVTLAVEDTGIGMSDEFLSHHLYTPFKQEDSHSTGTGLGLSIVKSIAGDLGANLDIQSQAGKGTTVTLDFMAAFSHAMPENSERRLHDALLDAPRSLLCPSVHLLTPERTASSDRVSTPDITPEERNFLDTAKEWLKCDISTGPTPRSPRNTLHVVAERHVLSLSKEADGFSSFHPDDADLNVNLLVLATSMQEAKPTQTLRDSWLRPIFVQQPIGPRKLFRAIQSLGEEQENVKPGKSDSYHDAPSTRQSDVQDDPTKADRHVPKVPSGAEATDSSAGEKRHKLLLVEDNEINMKLLVAFARRLKLQYHCATHGREALEAYSAAPRSFTVVFMDMQMPVMDGFTATALIRQEEANRQLPPVPIVALTGVTNKEARERAFDSGVNEYLSKPVKMRELEALVGKLETPEMANTTFRDGRS